MPNIKQYDTPALDIRPSEVGVESTAAAARRGGAFFNQAGEAFNQIGARAGSAIRDAGDEAVRQIAHQEISYGAATFAQLHADLTDKWNETVKNADPNDTSVAGKFNAEVLAPALEKFSGAFNTEQGQTWAESHVDALRNHLFEKASADMSTMAGQAVKVNVERATNAWTNTAFNDPSSAKYLMDQAESSIKGIVGSSPNLKGTAATAVQTEVLQATKEKIAKAAAYGIATKTGDEKAVQDFADRWPEYVNGTEARQIAKAAQVQNKSNMLADKQIQLYQRQVQDQAVHVESNKIMSDNVSIEPTTGRPVIKPGFFQAALDLAKKYPDAPSATTTARTLLGWGEHQQNLKAQPVVSDPAVRQDLTDRMFSTDKPTTEVQLMQAQIDGKISKDDFTAMHRLVTTLNESPLKGEVWKDTMSAVKDQLILNVPGIPGKDNVGVQNYAKFAQTFIPQYLAASRAGTLAPNALDTKDPKSMISQAMEPFKRTPAQRMSDYVSATGGIGATKREDVMPAIPPADQRTPGLYETPKGTMRWTGTGWVKP